MKEVGGKDEKEGRGRERAETEMGEWKGWTSGPLNAILLIDYMYFT